MNPLEHAFFYCTAEDLGEEVDGEEASVGLADTAGTHEASAICAAILLEGEARVEVEGEFVFREDGGGQVAAP